MKLRLASWLVLVGLLAGCTDPPPPAAAVNYRPTTTMLNFMVWGLEPAADVIWGSAGFILTEEGERDLQPTTQEGWDHVRNSATIVAESGNLLMMPGYSPGDADWNEYAAALVAAGMSAREAAQAQDADALFEAGGRVYNVCRACHNRYIIEAGQ